MTIIEPTPEPTDAIADVAPLPLAKKRSHAPILFVLLITAITVLWMQKRAQDQEANAPLSSTNAQVAPAAAPALEDSETPPAPTASLADEPITDAAGLNEKLMAQDARIKALEDKLAAAETGPDATAQSQSKLALEQANQTMTLLKSQMELLQQQLQGVKLQTQQQGLPVRQLQLWVVLAQLKIAVERGTASMPLVAQLREGWVESEPRELDALRQLAEASEYRIPTEAALLQDFHQLRKDVMMSLLQKDVGFWYRIKASLREHIRIRRLDKESTPAANANDDALQTLDETESMLAAGEVKAAIEAVNSLPNGRTAFESWLANAQRLVNARHAIDFLEKSLLESMQSTPLRESVFPNAEESETSDGAAAAQTPAGEIPSSPTVE